MGGQGREIHDKQQWAKKYKIKKNKSKYIINTATIIIYKT